MEREKEGERERERERKATDGTFQTFQSAKHSLGCLINSILCNHSMTKALLLLPVFRGGHTEAAEHCRKISGQRVRENEFKFQSTTYLLNMEGMYCANLATLELCFPTFLSLQSSELVWASRGVLRGVRKVGTKQQPCSFCAGKDSAGQEAPWQLRCMLLIY